MFQEPIPRNRISKTKHLRDNKVEMDNFSPEDEAAQLGVNIAGAVEGGYGLIKGLTWLKSGLTGLKSLLSSSKGLFKGCS